MKPTFLFIGAGQMATAMIKGLHNDVHIIASNKKNHQQLDYLHSTYGVDTTTNWKQAVPSCDVVILAIPPQAHKEILQELAHCITNQLVITVAGGIGLQLLQEMLPENTSISWVMPNTASEVKQSISLYTYSNVLPEGHQQLLHTFLDGIGESVQCTEEQILNLTAVTGSAPAFVYEFANALEEVSMSFGISKEQAKTLVAQMIFGSAMMLKGEKDSIALRNDVTSPGGSTAAGIQTLEEGQFSKLIQAAVHNTNKKAGELAK